MKKILKLLGLFLISLTVVFGGFIEVDAALTLSAGGESFTLGSTKINKVQVYVKDYMKCDSKGLPFLTHIGNSSDCGVVGEDGWYLTNNGKKLPNVAYNRHTAEAVDGDVDYILYCLDAILTATTEPLFAKRFSFYDGEKPADPKSHQYAYDVAIAHILRESSSSGTGYENYVAQSLAIRAVSAAFGNLRAEDGPTVGSHINLHKAIYGTTYEWISSVSAEYKTIKDAFDDGYYINLSMVGANNGMYNNKDYKINASGTTIAQNTLNTSKNLFINAIKAAAEHIDKAKGNPEVDLTSTPAEIGDITEQVIAGTGTYVTRKVKHTVFLKNFQKTDTITPEFYINNITFDRDYGTDGPPKIVELVVGDNNLCSDEASCSSFNDFNSVRKNLLEYVTIHEETSISITVQIGGYKSVEEGSGKTQIECKEENISYSLDYSYKSASSRSDYERDLFVVWYFKEDGISKQRFISYHGAIDGYDAESFEGTGKLQGSTNLVDYCDCDNLENACVDSGGNPGSDECKAYLDICEDCDFIKDLCLESGDPESLACKKLIEIEECNGCEILKEACLASDGPESTECKIYFGADCEDSCEALEYWCTETGDEEVCTQFEENCSCDFLESECANSTGPDSDECNAYRDSDCEECDYYATLCFEFGDEESCTKLKEDEACGCDYLAEECKEDGPDSQACDVYFEECPDGNCDVLKDLCDEYDDEESCTRFDTECGCEYLETACADSGDPGSDECKEFDEECGCPKLKEDCLITNDVESDECKEYFETCDEENCEILEVQCEITDDEEICNQYDVECGCTALANQCIAEGPDSEACDDFFDECSNDCENLKLLCDAGNTKACNMFESECGCDYLEKACVDSGDPNSDKCKEFFAEDKCGECDRYEALAKLGDPKAKEYYKEYCAPEDVVCETETTGVDECCDDANHIMIDEGDEDGAPEGQTYEIHGNLEEDIVSCFVEEADLGNNIVDEEINPYKLGGDIGDNKYCQVNCREDYLMTLPLAKRVNAGRYFTFQVSLQATKQCFTNTIDKDAFSEQIATLQNEVIEAANEYAYWEAAKAALTSNVLYEYCVDCDEKIITGVAIGTNGVKYSLEMDEQNFNSVTNINNGDTQEVKEYVEVYIRVRNYASESAAENAAKEELEELVDENLEDAKTALQDVNNEYDEEVEDYNECSSWEINYDNFDPKINYDYDEDYSSLARMPKEMNIKEMKIPKTKYSYCTQASDGSDPAINNTYDGCIDGNWSSENDNPATSAEDDDTNKEIVQYVSCSAKTGSLSCRTEGYNVSNVRYMRADITEAKVNFVPADLFYNIYPTGEISIESDNENGVQLVEKLPVALDTRKGIYTYSLDITNIGEYYSSGEQGRFVGGHSAVIDELTYICSYLVNIPDNGDVYECDAGDPTCEGPDCISRCVGDGCSDLDCDGDDCISECVGFGCIYDKDSGLSIYEKNVSVYNLFPNGTSSYNWDVNSDTDAAEKASATIAEIEEAAQSIYEEDEDLILSVTIDPTATAAIRGYNDEAEGEGGYSNASMYCRDVGSYEKLACYSHFIDGVLGGAYGEVNFGIEGRSGTDTDDGGYFKLWDGDISEDEMVGPSWK